MRRWTIRSLLFLGLIGMSTVVGFSAENSHSLADHLQVKIASSITKGERRNRERQSTPRKVCEGCQRPPILCVCDALPSKRFTTNTTLLILQHPNEFRKKTFSTVPLLSLVLEKVQVKVGYAFDIGSLPLVQEIIDQGKRPLLLFPSEDAISLDQLDHTQDGSAMTDDERTHFLAANEIQKNGNNLLILLDGTWAEAKRMALKSPELLSYCRPVAFSSPESSLYDAVRKEPEAHCLSTLEASAQALVLLEGALDEAQYLTNTLRSMVDRKLELERQRHDEPRHKGKQLHERERRRQQVENALFVKSESRRLECGAILRPLAIDDADAVNQNWYHRSSSSLATIRRRLEKGLACFGIERDGRLLGHIVRAEDGSLGMLHVDEAYRRQGYATLLVREATSFLIDAGYPKRALIQEGDAAVESLFYKLGWVVVKDSKSRTLKRQGYQRKWVLLETDANYTDRDDMSC